MRSRGVYANTAQALGAVTSVQSVMVQEEQPPWDRMRRSRQVEQIHSLSTTTSILWLCSLRRVIYCSNRQLSPYIHQNKIGLAYGIS
jgi:hypothetical protein